MAARRLRVTTACVTALSTRTSCSASRPSAVQRKGSGANTLVISRTSRAKGIFLMSRSVERWYLRISRSATVPGLYRCGFFTPPASKGHPSCCA